MKRNFVKIWLLRYPLLPLGQRQLIHRDHPRSQRLNFRQKNFKILFGLSIRLFLLALGNKKQPIGEKLKDKSVLLAIFNL